MSSSEESDCDSDILAKQLSSLDIYGDQDDDYEPGCWDEVPPYQDEISINGVEKYLLETARKESEIVVTRLMQHMFGRRKRSKKSVQPIHTLKCFLNARFLGNMRSFINKNIIDPVSSSELLAFVGVELALSFYTCTPGRYFDSANMHMFPVVRNASMTKDRYESILQALGASPGQEPSSSSNKSKQWL